MAPPRVLLPPRVLVIVLASAACSGAPSATPTETGSESGAAATIAAPTATRGATGPVRFGVLPAIDAARTAEIYAPLVSGLSEVLSRPVELHVASGYDALLADMIDGKAQLAQVSATLFARAALLRGRMHKPLHLLAQEHREDDSPRAGAFVVAPKSTVKDLASAKGQRMLYVDPDSSSGFYYPRMRLRALDLDPDTHFGSVGFAGSHDEVVRRLKAGEADLGAISELTAGLSGLTIIERTADVPDDALVSLEGLSDADRALVTAFLLGAHQNPALTNLFVARGIERYVPAVVEVFEATREEMARTAESAAPAP